MLEVPSIVSLRGLGKSVVSSDQDAHPSLAEFCVDRGRGFNHALHLPSNFGISMETELFSFVERAVDDADSRSNKYPILHRLQQVDRFLVRRFTVVDHVDP